MHIALYTLEPYNILAKVLKLVFENDAKTNKEIDSYVLCSLFFTILAL